MELQLANKLQHHIADLLWEAKDTVEVKKIISIYGKDAHVVFHMMMAAHFDTHMDTDIASDVLKIIFKNER